MDYRPTGAELLTVFYFLLSLTTRPHRDCGHALYLDRSWVWEDWSVRRNLRAVRASLGYSASRSSGDLGRTKFYACVRELADVADDDMPAVQAVRHGRTNDDLFRLSKENADWEDLLAQLSGEDGHLPADAIDAARQTAAGLGLSSEEEIPTRVLRVVAAAPDEFDDEDQTSRLSPTRRCSRCGIVKRREEFSESSSMCKAPCRVQYDAERAAKPEERERAAERAADYRARLAARTDAQIAEDRPDEKQCPSCRESLRHVYFSADYTRRDCLSYMCSRCTYLRRLDRAR